MNDIQLEIAAYLCRQVCASWLDSESNPSNEGRVVHCTVAVNYRDLSDQNQHRLVSLAAEIIKYILEFHQTKKKFFCNFLRYENKVLVLTASTIFIIVRNSDATKRQSSFFSLK